MSAGLVLDAVLLLLLVAYAVSGAQRGFVHGSLSLAGFFAGGMLGIVVLPEVVGGLRDGGGEPLLPPGFARVLVVVLGVLLLASLGQVAGSFAGSRLRERVTWRPARLVDRSAGAVAALVAVALLTWFVASALRASPSPALSRAVAQSQVVRVVDRVVPAGVGGLAQGLRDLMSTGGFPRVFDGVGPEVILPVDPPADVEVTGAAAAAAGGIVKVTGVAGSCARGQEGTGFVVAPGRVVTNAHVVAGVDEPSVRVGGEGRAYDGEVVLMDTERDLAVLAVPDLPAAALPLGRDLERGAPAVVAGFPLDGPYTAEPARVRQVLTARGRDIYGEAGVDRQVYSLFARVEPGNSGGPLLDASGQVVGVVFAKSLDDPQTGYALTLTEAMPVLERAVTATSPVDVGPCASR